MLFCRKLRNFLCSQVFFSSCYCSCLWMYTICIAIQIRIWYILQITIFMYYDDFCCAFCDLFYNDFMVRICPCNWFLLQRLISQVHANTCFFYKHTSMKFRDQARLCLTVQGAGLSVWETFNSNVAANCNSLISHLVIFIDL